MMASCDHRRMLAARWQNPGAAPRSERPRFVFLKYKFAVHVFSSVSDPAMRKINTRSFRLATRATPREVNRQIVLNLIREQQPISRAELARRMNVRRASLTTLV